MVLENLFQIKKKDVDQATLVLTKAFHEDPLIQLIYPDPEERKIFSPILWSFMIKDGINYGEVYAPSNKIEGVAKWLPP